MEFRKIQHSWENSIMNDSDEPRKDGIYRKLNQRKLKYEKYTKWKCGQGMAINDWFVRIFLVSLNQYVKGSLIHEWKIKHFSKLINNGHHYSEHASTSIKNLLTSN
jgi:hypothetical protein